MVHNNGYSTITNSQPTENTFLGFCDYCTTKKLLTGLIVCLFGF